MPDNTIGNDSFYDEMNKIIHTNYTEKGTKIVKPGEEMDKNAFLRILTAELANQDPMNTKDSTQYVAQMAQFASIEQMANLNTNITFTGATALIGKTVGLNATDPLGNQYIGIVRAVSKSGSKIKLSIEMGEGDKKELREFNYEDVSDITDLTLKPTAEGNK